MPFSLSFLSKFIRMLLMRCVRLCFISRTTVVVEFFFSLGVSVLFTELIVVILLAFHDGRNGTGNMAVTKCYYLIVYICFTVYVMRKVKWTNCSIFTFI